MVPHCSNIHLCFLIRADLQPVQGHLLDRLPVALCTGQFRLSVSRWYHLRPYTAQQEGHANQDPRRLHRRDPSHGDLGLFRLRLPRTVSVPLLHADLPLLGHL